MPVIRVEMFKGRTHEQKKAMVREVTDAFARTTGSKPESVHVVITDVEPSDWGIAGELASDKT